MVRTVAVRIPRRLLPGPTFRSPAIISRLGKDRALILPYARARSWRGPSKARCDRSLRWIRIDGRVLFDADGVPYGSFGICQDITDTKNREQELNDLLDPAKILAKPILVHLLLGARIPQPAIIRADLVGDHDPYLVIDLKPSEI